ncbi:DHHW family protein [Porphyromonas sp.]|uniref:DHHW family protein n=1 Tax=Porphyromonas sp. TaxID=1924944 RepID=UPI0026DBEAC9|nr:DHHW family protein [Porphyromonas sp.]MDO4771429.1 DHHW family protein [Porphyromonas sp.]
MKQPKLFLYIVLALFAGFALVFNFLPRSRYSELEKRELATFPAFSSEKLWSGQWARDISTWFSDSEPYRDQLMTLSMVFKDKVGLPKGEGQIKIHGATLQKPEEIVAEAPTAPAPTVEAERPTEKQKAPTPAPRDNEEPTEEDGEIAIEEMAKLSDNGIIVVGKGENVRALMAFGGSKSAGNSYAEAANTYQQALGDSVQVYCMVIPTAAEFYCPEKVKKYTRPQRPVVDQIHNKLDPQVKAVDVIDDLRAHSDEPIYLRTDHHWAPLGAYYAARKFAAVADVPLPDIETYERRVVKGFVGTMYAYSKDISIKKAPEDFVYYVPQGIEYKTTYIQYKVDSLYRVVGESNPVSGAFFKHYKDGHGGAYSTFMGGDSKITKVETSTPNGRRLVILKDSFGNAIPGYLFQSFEQVHVIDVRYFTRNMITYVKENRITDILFANNIFNSCNPRICKRYIAFLKQ